MAKLTGQTIAASYDQLLIVNDANGISASLQAIEAGDTGGSASSLKISTSKCEVIPASNSTSLFEVSQADGTAVLSVDTTNVGVGIGTASPDALLELSKNDDAHLYISSFHDTESKSPAIYFRRGEGTEASHASPIDAGATLGQIVFSGYDGNSYVNGAKIMAISDENWAQDSASGTHMRFYTIDNTTQVEDERMRIDHNGYVGIGTTNPGNNLHVSTADGSGECWVKIDANTGSDSGILLAEEGTNQWALKHEADDGDLYVWDFQDGSRAVHIVDTGNTWVNDSDSRIKKDITNIDSVLDGINSLRPVTYKKKYGTSDTVHPGLIAQEVLPHFPLVVTGANRTFKEIPADDDLPLRFSGAMGIGYSDFIPYLIKAIQELSAKVTALENA